MAVDRYSSINKINFLTKKSANDFTPSCSLILGSFIFLCLLATFFPENKFLSNFSIAYNFNVLYTVQTDPNNNVDESTSILHGFKFGLVVGSIVAHNNGLPMSLFFTQAFSQVKEVKFSDWIYVPLSRVYSVADVSLIIFNHLNQFHSVPQLTRYSFKAMFFLGGFYAFWAW